MPMAHKPEEPLESLLVAIGGGDEVAFRRLVDRAGQRIFAMAYRLLQGDRYAAEDAVQDVLIKIWQLAPRWEERGSAQGWISQITYTVCMDIYRKRKGGTDSLPEENEAPPPEPLRTPETATDGLLQQEQRAWILDGIKHLPERQQQALLLTYFHENKRQEVAAAMETTEKAVEHLIARGLKGLAALLPANLNDGEDYGHQKTAGH
jgi:RNA polymerase sigma factor (sigma-70 family)